MNDRLVGVVPTVCKGRAVVAKKFLKAGTIIVAEEPFVCVPFSTSSFSSLCTKDGSYKLSTVEMSIKEPPSSGCDGSNSFSGNLRILASRYLIRSKTLDKSSRILRNHISIQDAISMSGMRECSQVVHSLIVAQTSDHETVITIERCMEILCILICNLFTVIDDFQNEAGIGCYPYAALLNHSCEPNCIQRFNDQSYIIIRTAVDVAPGEELTISYIDTGMPTWKRQQELLSGYKFHCTCSRCTRIDLLDSYICTSSQCMGLVYPTESDQYRDWTAGHCAMTRAVNYIGSEIWHFPHQHLIQTHCATGSLQCASCSATGSLQCASCSATGSLQCASCGSCRVICSIQRVIMDISTSWKERETVTLDIPANERRTSVSTNMTKANTSTSVRENQSYKSKRYSLLFEHIKRCELILSKLFLLVRRYHYCVLFVRKSLKSAFETSLPVQNGVLLFVDIAGEVKHIGDVIKAEKLQALYEDNLKEIIAAWAYCYSPYAPNLSNTYYRIQLVWFILSKQTCDITLCQEVLQCLPRLMNDIRVVYGDDHLFFIDMERCRYDLLRRL